MRHPNASSIHSLVHSLTRNCRRSIFSTSHWMRLRERAGGEVPMAYNSNTLAFGMRWWPLKNHSILLLEEERRETRAANGYFWQNNKSVFWTMFLLVHLAARKHYNFAFDKVADSDDPRCGNVDFSSARKLWGKKKPNDFRQWNFSILFWLLSRPPHIANKQAYCCLRYCVWILATVFITCYTKFRSRSSEMSRAMRCGAKVYMISIFIFGEYFVHVWLRGGHARALAQKFNLFLA